MDLFIEVSLLALIIIIGLVLRYLPHILHAYPYTPDMYYHLVRLRDWEYETERRTYPKFFHQFFRLFLKSDKPLPERVLFRITPLFDICTGITVHLFLRTQFGIETSLLTVSLFLLTPIVVKQSITFGVRPMGMLFVTCSLLFLTLPFPFNWLSIIPVSLTLLTHKLSTQTLFFALIGFSIIAGDWQPAAIYIVGFGLAVLLSRRYYLRVARFHLTNALRHFQGERYPNQRLKGLLITSTAVGLVIYIVVQWVQLFLSFPLTILGLVISVPVAVAPYFETLLMSWGLVCLLLLIFWFIGESYKHLYIGGVAFAFFSAYLIQYSPLFFVLSIVLLGGNSVVSLYISVRFPYLDKDIVTLLRQTGKLQTSTYILVPKGLRRVVEYFSGNKAANARFARTTPEAVAKRIGRENITHVIITGEHLEWFPEMKRVSHIGKWYLLQLS